MGDERAERDARLADCRTRLLPIWERWTGGDPALRGVLDCPSTDTGRQEERLRLLIAATGELRGRGDGDPGVRAALLAASACLRAYIRVPEREWRESMQRALLAGQDTNSTAVFTE